MCSFVRFLVDTLLAFCTVFLMSFEILRFINRKKKNSSLHPQVVFKSANFQGRQHGKNVGGEVDMFSRVQGKGDTQGGGKILNWEIENVGCVVAQFQEFMSSVLISLWI